MTAKLATRVRAPMRRAAADHDVGVERDAVAERHVPADDGVGADRDVRAEARAVLNDRSRMNETHETDATAAAIIAVMTASATTVPPHLRLAAELVDGPAAAQLLNVILQHVAGHDRLAEFASSMAIR